jgi:hypothetical protein
MILSQDVVDSLAALFARSSSELHRYAEGGRTACGKRLRQPGDPPPLDAEGKPIKRTSLSYTCRDEWTTCPDCLTTMRG